jgi:hypothetical protein
MSTLNHVSTSTPAAPALFRVKGYRKTYSKVRIQEHCNISRRVLVVENIIDNVGFTFFSRMHCLTLICLRPAEGPQ